MSESSTRAADDSSLSIGQLAARTGLSPATLRMWEQRHGFPVPQRRESGHRRYDERDVRAVEEVRARRDAGTRLDVAISQVLDGTAPHDEGAGLSVYAELRRHHPHLEPARLHKSTLVGLSWAIEDEFCARADRAHLFGAFQRQVHWAPSRRRWAELARVARSTYVFADFDAVSVDGGAVLVPLAEDTPMRREWTLVCDARELPAVLTAWELPGQEDVPDRDRVFESLWSVEPAVVRDAARVCTRVAAAADAPGAAEVLHRLADEPSPGAGVDLRTVTTLFNRVVGYVDQATAR